MAEPVFGAVTNTGAQQVSKKDMILTLAAALLGWMFDGFSMGLFPRAGRPALLEMLGPDSVTIIGTWLARIAAGFLIGAAIGGVLFGWLGDRIGRVKAMVFAITTYAVFSTLCVFVHEPWQLAGLWFLASLGMGGEWSLGVALVMEAWPSGSRVLLAGLIGAAANVGFLLIGLLGLFLASIMPHLGADLINIGLPETWANALVANSGWRFIMLLGALPALVAFFVIFFVPESKKWQHAAATTPKNKISDIFKGHTGKLAILGAMMSSIALLGMWGSAQWIPFWAAKLSGPGTNWISKAQVSLAIGAIIGCIIGAYVAKWTSRRWAYFILCLAALISCAYLFRSPMQLGWFYLFNVVIVGATTASFFGWLPLYLPELFPTRIRATATGFAFNFGRVLAAAGTLAAGGLLNYFKEDYARMCAVISLVYIIGLFVIWLCPETKDKPLPE